MTKKETQQREVKLQRIRSSEAESSKRSIKMDVSLRSLRASEAKTRAMRMKTKQESKSKE